MQEDTGIVLHSRFRLIVESTGAIVLSGAMTIYIVVPMSFLTMECVQCSHDHVSGIMLVLSESLKLLGVR